MKNKKIRTSPLTLPEHFGALPRSSNRQTAENEGSSAWPWIWGSALFVVGVAVLVLPTINTKYVTKEDALAEALKNDEKHIHFQRKQSISIAKVKHEMRKTKRRQKALEQRIEELEYDLFDNA